MPIIVLEGYVPYRVPNEDSEIIRAFCTTGAYINGLRHRSTRARGIVDDLVLIITGDGGDPRDDMTRRHAADHFVARTYPLAFPKIAA